MVVSLIINMTTYFVTIRCRANWVTRLDIRLDKIMTNVPTHEWTICMCQKSVVRRTSNLATINEYTYNPVRFMVFIRDISKTCCICSGWKLQPRNPLSVSSLQHVSFITCYSLRLHEFLENNGTYIFYFNFTTI